MPSILSKKRVNFIITASILNEMNELVPEGERSNFVSEAIEEKLIQLSRQKSSAFFAEFRKKCKHKTSTEKILKDMSPLQKWE